MHQFKGDIDARDLTIIKKKQHTHTHSHTISALLRSIKPKIIWIVDICSLNDINDIYLYFSFLIETENMEWISRNHFHFHFQFVGQTNRRTIGLGFKSDVKKSLPEHYAWPTRRGSRNFKTGGGGNKIQIVNIAC